MNPAIKTELQPIITAQGGASQGTNQLVSQGDPTQMNYPDPTTHSDQQMYTDQEKTSREILLSNSIGMSEGYPQPEEVANPSIMVMDENAMPVFPETTEVLQEPEEAGQASASYYNFAFTGKEDGNTAPSLLKTSSAYEALSYIKFGENRSKINLTQKTYDPYRIPPDWDMVDEHNHAVRVARPRMLSPDQPIDVDEMSGRPIYNDRLSACCKPDELSFLGPSYPMYFQFLVFTWSVLGVFILTTGLFSLISNFLGDFCGEDPTTITASSHDIHCPSLIETRLSLANVLNNSQIISVWQILNLVAYLGCVVIFQFFRFRQRKFAAECDERELTASDFTVEVKNIPRHLKDIDLRQEIKDFMIDHAFPGRKTSVMNVVLSFDVSEKMKIVSEIEALTVKSVRLERQKARGEEIKESIDDIKQKIAELKDKLKLLQQEYESGKSDKFLGRAYVTVNTQQEVGEIVQYWKRGRIRRAIERFRGISGRLFHGSPIIVEPADEPSDIFWENLGVSFPEKVKKRIISLACTLLTLAICFAIVLGLSLLKYNLASGGQISKEDFFLIQTLSTLTSMVVVVVNMILAQICRRLTLFEQYSSWTNFYISAAEKQTWAMFFNNALITFLIYYFIHNYWGNGGMIKVITQVFIINTFYGPIYNLINPFFQLKRYQRFKARKLGDNSLLTQKQANLMYEDVQTDFALLYSSVMKNMFTAAFYAPIVPMALFWTLLSNVLEYFVDKFNITHRGSITRSLGPRLAIQMTELMEFFLIIYAVSNVIFNIIFIKESGQTELKDIGIGLPITVIVLLVLHALLPMGWVNKKLLFGKIKERATTDTYESLRLYLDEDYDRANPATSEKAIDDFSKEIQANGDPVKYYNNFLKKHHLNQDSK